VVSVDLAILDRGDIASREFGAKGQVGRLDTIIIGYDHDALGLAHVGSEFARREVDPYAPARRCVVRLAAIAADEDAVVHHVSIDEVDGEGRRSGSECDQRSKQ
jgi:hypothetical protein